jgi:hypothetical protein
MAYEAVPEGVEIQKLTSAQRDALSRYKIHENINTFLGNENTPTLLGSVGLLAFTTILLDLLLKALQDRGDCPPLTPGEEAEIKKELQRQLLEISPITAGLKTLEAGLRGFQIGEKGLA